jgi:ribonuclease T1
LVIDIGGSTIKSRKEQNVNANALRKWLCFLAALLFSFNIFAKEAISSIGVIALADLPIEAQKTIILIKQGGPFPYARDGAVFGNYEGVLPKQKRGYYHEFTVKTAGMRNRGARRIIVGGKPIVSREYYYTADHYATFKRIKE